MNLAKNKDAANAAFLDDVQRLVLISYLNWERKFDCLPDDLYDQLLKFYQSRKNEILRSCNNIG